MNTSVQTHAEAAEEAVQSAVEVQRFPEKFEATVTGNVQHRVGDGQLEDIPRGTRVQVATAIGSYVLSWTQDEQPITVSLAKREFELYVDTAEIEVSRRSRLMREFSLMPMSFLMDSEHHSTCMSCCCPVLPGVEHRCRR